MTQIANPIYDVVFKFLMEDTASAIILLSTIIEEEIETLELLPQENIAHLAARSLTVYRLDFSAKIKTAQGHKHVLIEIQKAKLPSDIMRFRRYLGEQYSKKNNVYAVYDERKQEIVHKPLPIITIYFLGYALENINTPVVKINRHYYDVIHRCELHVKEEFIESLNHDSYVIQISQLRKQHQTELEELLSIFDQTHQLIRDEHILEIDEQAYAEKYRILVRRLQSAVLDPELRHTMDMEDEILEDLQSMERLIEKKELELVEKNRAIAEKDQVLSEKERALSEKEQAISEKDQALAEKDKLIAALKKQLSSQE